MNHIERRDKLLRAKDFAAKLAARNGYRYTEWLKGRAGLCKAGFERDGEFWSLGFNWTLADGFDRLQHDIEKLDFMLTVAQREFASLKFGAAMKAAGHSPQTAAH